MERGGECMRQYIKVEVKRFFHILPGFFWAVVTVLLFSVLLFSLARRFLPETLTVIPFRVGLCVEGDDLMSNYVNGYIRQMDSIEGLMKFEEVSADEIFEERMTPSLDTREAGAISRRKVQDLLEKKKFAACIVIPERTVQSVMDGTNIPVQVVMAAGTEHAERYLQERLLALLTECGAVMIDVPQAETLLLYEMQVENPEKLGQTLDLFHFGLVLGREDWFVTETISAFGGADLEEYYFAAGLTLFFLFWGLGCGSFFRTGEDNMPLLLARKGVMLPCQHAIRQGVYILWYLTVFFVLSGIFVVQKSMGGNTGGDMLEAVAVPSPALLFLGILCAVMLALQSSFFFEIVPTTAGGIALNAVFGFLEFFGAGGILPPVFLPRAMTELCGRLPGGICMEWMLRNIAGNGKMDGKMVGGCLLWCLIFGTAGVLVFCVKHGATDYRQRRPRSRG